MKKTIIILFISLFFTNVRAQKKIEGIIKDSITQKNIPFVNVSYLDLNIGTMSDEEGFFNLKKIDTLKYIQISSLGYENKIINIKKIDSVIYLKPKTEALNEVVVYGKNIVYKKNIKLGLNQSLNKIKTSLPIGYEFSAYIENEYEKKGIIKEVILNLNKAKEYDIIPTYNIKFYSYDSIKKQPGELLSEKNIFVKPENKSYKLKFDVESMKIILPKKGICVGIELVNIENFKITSMSRIAPKINFTHTDKVNLTWVRFMNKKWNKDGRQSRINKNKYINANINITALIE